MRVHSLQHVEFEDLANIEPWLREKGHSVTKTHLWNHESLPPLDPLDWLILMGGPMNIDEDEKYEWLVQEKEFIRAAIARGKLVLGVCLGAQLIADALGGRVYKNGHKEIGWHVVNRTAAAKKSKVLRVLPGQFIAFHWHGDTFDLPPACQLIASSDGCLNQAFEFDHGRVIGLQFHLESTADSIRGLIRNCAGDLTEGRYVQPADEILANLENVRATEPIMKSILNQMHQSI
jgi:GMP synthase-like glutamine amidotransferase